MKICVFGAGAIGGLIGATISRARNAPVAAVARGATLDALSRHGWRAEIDGRLVQAPALAVADAAELGPQDVVFVALKGPALTQAAPAIARLLKPDTTLIAAMNGVPWWFAGALPDPFNAPLESVDPGGAVSAALPPASTLGCVVRLAADAPEPGLARLNGGRLLILGEPRGGETERLQGVVRLLADAGFDTEISRDIRRDVWFKLWGNLTMNPISALTGATTDLILSDPLLRAFCSAAMNEAAQIGARIGCAIDLRPEDRHAETEKLGAMRTSMLQDARAGRPLEIEAIVGAVAELGRRVGVASPNVDAIYGLARVFARQRGQAG